MGKDLHSGQTQHGPTIIAARGSTGRLPGGHTAATDSGHRRPRRVQHRGRAGSREAGR